MKTTNSAGAAATYAEDAFGATSSEGGEIDAASGIGEDLPTIEAPGTGAPGGDTGGGGGGCSCPSNWTQWEGGGCEPPDLDGVNVTDYQDKLDAAKGMADQAEKLTTTALALLVIGAILVATGWMSSLGWALIAIGGLMLLMAQMMSSQSMNMGQQIADQHGQKDQGKIVERYGSNSDTHVNAGHEGEAWKESEMDSEMEDTKNATYTMDGGGSGGVQ